MSTSTDHVRYRNTLTVLRDDSSFETVHSLCTESANYVGIIAKVQDQMANAFVKKICQPLDELYSQYDAVKYDICGDHNQSKSGEVTGEKLKKRALAKVRVAEDEYQMAQQSREQLVRRFGNEIKPVLLKKAEERVKRAESLKRQAESELKTLDNQPAMAREENPSDEKAYRGLTPESLVALERAETSRVTRTLDCSRLAVKLFFTYIETISSPLAALSSSCDIYSPQYDLGLWLQQTTGSPHIPPLRIKDDQKFALDERDVKWLLRDSDSGTFDASLVAKLRSELQRKTADAEELHSELEKLRDQQQQNFPKRGAASESERSDSVPAEAAATPCKKKQLDFVSPSSGITENTQAQPPKPVNNFLRRVATAITGRQMLTQDAHRLGTDSDEESWDDDTQNPQDWEDDDDLFKLSDYVPSLKDRLRIKWPANTKLTDRALEIERRIEEYLWSLRNLNVDELARSETWESNNYVMSFDYEFGFPAYVHKFPKHTYFTAYNCVVAVRALEWGSSYMPTFQWRLFGYETLILAHQIGQKIIQLRELSTLPQRDVAGNNSTVMVNEARRFTAQPRKTTRGGETNMSLLDAPQSAMHSMEIASNNFKYAVDDPHLQGAQIILHNTNYMKQLLRQWRVNLGMTSKENMFLVYLLIPQHRSGESAHNPLDVRYRLSCLLRCWMNKEEIKQEMQALGDTQQLQKHLNDFIFRNLHFVRCSILFKLQRFNRFLPQLSGVTRWLSTWTTCQDWCTLIQSSIPPPLEEDNEFTHDNISKLVSSFKLMCIILSDLLGAHFSGTWGNSCYLNSSMPVTLTEYNPTSHLASGRSDCVSRFDDRSDASYIQEGASSFAGGSQSGPGYGYRNPEGILRLCALMSCVETLDKCIRTDIAQDERSMVPGSHEFRVDDDDILSDDNPQALGCEGLLESDKFDVFKTQSSLRLDVYWQYELPVQHLILSHACELICDVRNRTLSPGAISIIQTIVIFSHLMQHGMDPTTTASDLRHSAVTTTLDTIKLYLIQGLWIGFLQQKDVTEDFDFKLDETGQTASQVSMLDRQSEIDGEPAAALPPNLLLSEEPLNLMITLATEFVSWLMTIGAPSHLGDIVSLSETVTVRLLNSSMHNLFDVLETPRGKFRTSSASNPYSVGDDRRLRDHTDPDFAVLEYASLDEVAHKPSFFHQLETIRHEFEGVSMVLPSRVERMIGELCLRRCATNTFRNQLFLSLCDYRRHYDTSSLPLAVELWRQVNDLMVLTPSHAVPKPLDVNQLQSVVALPILLNGPLAFYDLLRHFISRSIAAVFDRAFSDALSTIKNPSDEESWFLQRLSDLEDDDEQRVEIEKAWGAVINKFGVASRKMIIELKTEIIHYAEIWSSLLPSNQHAMIAMYTIGQKFRAMLEELRMSPFWPEDTLPPCSAGITSSLNQFDKLLNEVRKGSRFENLLAEEEPLAAPLSASVASALSKRLRTIEPLLARCVLDDWKPVDPPRALYSAGAVDFFQFIHHVLNAVWEYEASTEWVMPILLQFLLRVSRQYGEKIKSTVAEIRLTHVDKYVEQIIANLTNPTPRVDISLIGQLMGKHKKKGIKKIFGFGSKKNKHADIAAQIRDLKFDEQGELVTETAAEEVDEEGELSPIINSNDLNPAEISDDLKELANRIGPGLALQLYGVSLALDPTGSPNSGVKTWLTRLHNLNYFQSEVGSLATRILQTASARDKPSGTESSEVMTALEKAGGRRATAGLTSDRDDEAKFQLWQNQMVETVAQCRAAVNMKAVDVCKYCALRIVYFDLSEDLFEDIYHPTIGTGNNLTSLINALDSTVFKFVNATPVMYRECLLREIIVQLIKAWLTLVTELGYMGYRFESEDVDVIDNDLQSLKLLAKQYSIKEDLEVGGQTVNMFNYISEFVVFLGTQPTSLAQLGGNYDKKKPEAPSSQPPTAGGGLPPVGAGMSAPPVEYEPEVKNMFAGLGTAASPAFKAEEIIGKKKNKGVFKGAMKLLKMK